MVLALWLYFGANQYSTCFFFQCLAGTYLGHLFAESRKCLIFLYYGMSVERIPGKRLHILEIRSSLPRYLLGGIGSLVLLGGIISFF